MIITRFKTSLVISIFFITYLIPLSGFSDVNTNYIKPDSVNTDYNIAKQKLSKDYDSLLHTWYVQHSFSDIDSTELNYSNIDSIRSLYLNDSVIRTKMSKMPVLFDMTYNKVVKAYMKVYLEKKRDLTETVLGLSNYYFPIFESILDEKSMPLELKYLPVIESALNPRAVSRVGATGLWQFMYSTGRFLNLKINSLVDERCDVIKSTRAAADYLNSLYEIFGDWTLALAAYNCGPGNVNKAIMRSGGKTNFWDIYYYLPRETRGYVPGFIAVIYIFNNYNDFNLQPHNVDMPELTDTVKVDQKLHLKQVAEVMGIPLNQLKDLNPQFRYNIIPNDKDYFLRLPYKTATTFIDLEDSIYSYKDSVFFNSKLLTAKPSNSRYYRGAPTGSYKKLYYTVKMGDNLGFIADWYDVRVRDIRYWNGIRGHMIRSGQRLRIYVPKSKYRKYKRINSLSFAQKQKIEGKTVNQKTNKAQALPDDGKYLYYTLKNGETLWEVAKRYNGISDRDILRINGLTSGRSLKAGQRIRIKRVE